jgi:hypothetical protein
MPPRWPRQPDRQDPAYRKLDDRMNFAVHVAVFFAANSGLWFVHNLKQAQWSWLSAGWLLGVLLHLIYILAIANYSRKSYG